jgi:hypothetical protein
MSHVVTYKLIFNSVEAKGNGQKSYNRKLKTKEREEKRFNKVQHMITQKEQIAKKSIEKQNKATFNKSWSTIAIRVVGKRFHNNFKLRFQAHP